MANGFCPALMRDLTEWYPVTQKVTEIGATQLLLDAPRPEVLQNSMSDNGHFKSAIVRYMPRGVISQAHTTIDCSIDQTPAFLEKNVSFDQSVSMGLYFAVDTIRQYCADASRTVLVGAPPTPLMVMVRDAILTKLNAAYQLMDQKIAQAIIAAAPATASINISLAANTLDLDSGMTKLLGVLQDSEFCDMPQIVGGSNLFRNFTQIRRANALYPNQAGLQADLNSDYDFYYDRKMRTLLATNDILAIDRGSVALLENIQNVGSFAGQHGTSFFGTMVDPRVQCRGIGNAYQDIVWDMQIREIDCPTTLSNAYTGGTINATRGYAVYISKSFTVWTTPTDVNDGADVNAGFNGIKRFTITNT